MGLWRRKELAIDTRLEQAEREVDDLKLRVKVLETQSAVFKRKAERVIKEASAA